MAKKDTSKKSPAKKATRKTATKAAKKTAKKAAKKGARKVDRKTAAKAPQPREEPAAPVTDLATLAYFIYLDRVEKGLPGDALSDWAAAEKASQAA